MENNTEIQNPVVEVPTATTSGQQMQESAVVAPVKPNKKKAQLFILVPLLFWLLAIALMFAFPDKTITRGSGDFAVTEVRQNTVVQTISLISFLSAPVLLALLCYGIVLLIKKPTSTSTRDVPVTKPSYKTAHTTLVVGMVLLAIAFGIVWNIRSQVGYSGSEAEIGSFPFLLGGMGSILVSGILYTSAFVRRARFEKTHSSSQV